MQKKAVKEEERNKRRWTESKKKREDVNPTVSIMT